MSRFLPACIIIAFLITGSSLFAAPVEQDAKPSAIAIFDAALAQFEASRAALSKWQYYQTLTTHQLDSNGTVVAKGTWHSIVRPGDPQPLEYTGEKVEGKISFFKGGSEESTTPDASTSPKPNANIKVEKNQAESAVEAVRKYDLRNRYLWKRLPNDVASGEDAYVISFEPKPNQNTSSREERFLSLLAGRLWISRNDFTLLKAEASLQSPCHLFWIIAQVTDFQLNYELEPARGNRLLRMSRASARTVVKFPFVTIRQKHWQTVERYEPRTPRGSSR